MSTSIEWSQNPDGTAGETWNPIKSRNLETGKIGWHCERISPGCQRCYSETQNAAAFRGGTGLLYVLPNRSKVEIFLDQKMLEKPLRWEKPRGIFVCSMSDWCADFVPDDWRDRMMAVVYLAQQHHYMFLTKRADALRSYLRNPGDLRTRIALAITGPRLIPQHKVHLGLPSPTGIAEGIMKGWRSLTMPGIRLGVSVETQEWADKRLPILCELGESGWNTMVSVEPMLGPVVLPERFLALGKRTWAIIGGESGKNARPFDVGWARGIIQQCQAAKVPVFCKQLGSRPIIGERPFMEMTIGQRSITLKDRKGGDPSEWESDLRVREMPEV